MAEWEVSLASTGPDNGYCFKANKKGSTYTRTFSMVKYPTGNCQLCCIGTLANIFSIATERADVQAIVRKAAALMSHGLLLVLVDVKSNYIPTVEACFKVITKTPYISSNSSSMCLFIVQLDPPPPPPPA